MSSPYILPPPTGREKYGSDRWYWNAPYSADERGAARRLRRNCGWLTMWEALILIRNVRLRDRAARRRQIRKAEKAERARAEALVTA